MNPHKPFTHESRAHLRAEDAKNLPKPGEIDRYLAAVSLGVSHEEFRALLNHQPFTDAVFEQDGEAALVAVRNLTGKKISVSNS